MENLEYENAMRKFVLWITENKYGKENTTEENLQSEKNRIIDMTNKLIDSGFDNSANPFVSLFTMMFTQINGLASLKKLTENVIGHELSNEQFDEYVKLVEDKRNVEDVIKFLSNDLLDFNNDVIPPIICKFLQIKELVLPALYNKVDKLDREMQKYFSK